MSRQSKSVPVIRARCTTQTCCSIALPRRAFARRLPAKDSREWTCRWKARASIPTATSSSGSPVEGMDVSLESESFDPDSHFLFWKPGGTPWREPAGMAWRLDPGNALVLNVHLRPIGRPEPVQPSVAFYFTREPPSKSPMLIQLEHDGALDIPPGDADFVVSDEIRLPVDLDVLAVYPHAHYLGKLLEGFATLPDGQRRWLIRIPDWDLNWQAVYRLKKPLFLPQGTGISMRSE